MSISSEDISLYQILSRFQILPPGRVKQIQDTQQQLLQQGKRIPLVQLLKEYQVLSAQQLSWLLQVQQKGYLFCKGCSQAYSFPQGPVQPQYNCPKCQNPLLILSAFGNQSPSSSRLEHPNIIPVYDGGYLQGNIPYYAMKELKGGTLKDFLKETPEEEKETLRPFLLDVYLKVCDAIEYAHSEGVIHRDLKPSNIAVGDFGEVIVMDWGIAKYQGIEDLELEETQQSPRLSSMNVTQDDLTLEGDILGTPGYLSPEQARGEDADKRSDVFALGSILYEILCFSNPFPGNPQKKIMATLMEEPPAPHLMASHLNIPGELSSIAMKALTKDKYKRYQNVSQLKEDIFRYRAGFGVSASRDSVGKSILRAMKRHKGIALAAAACFIAVFLSLAFVKWWDMTQRKRKIQEHTTQADKELQSSRLKEAREIASSKNGATNLVMERKIERAIEIYSKARDGLEKALQISPKDAKLRQKLYDVEKWIGILSLRIRNYLLAKASFERCQKLFPDQKEDGLMERVEKERKALHENQKTRLRAIMAALDKGPPEPGMMDEYITEVVKMNSSTIVEALLGYLCGPNEWQRKLAVEALGKIGDRNTQREGRDVGQWLVDRLKTMEPRKDVDEAVALVWALGRLRYGPANELIFEIRQKNQNTPFYHRTALPYRWIPSSPSKKISGEKEKWDQKGAMAMLKGDFSEALRCYQMFVQENPRDFVRYFLYGDALLKMGRLPEAIEKFNKTLELKENFPGAYLERGSAWLNLGEMDKALKDLKKALSLNPKIPDVFGTLGVYWTKKGNQKKALFCFNKALSLNSNSDLYYKNRGEIYRRMKQFDKALQDCNQAIALNPKNSEAHHVIGLVFQNTGKGDKAIEAFNQAIALNPKNSSFYNSRAAYYFSIKKHPEARENFEKAIELNSKDHRSHCNLGIVLMTQGKFDQALESFSRSIALKESFPIPYQWMGLIYFQKKKFLEALKYFKKALEYHKEVKFYNFITVCCIILNRHQEALPYIEKALALEPKNPTLHNNLGHVYLGLKKYSEAFKAYNQALQLNPNLAEALTGRGRLLWMAKNYSLALKDLNQAIGLKGNLSGAYFWRGHVRRALGQKKLALQDFQKFIQMSPESSKAKIARQIIKELTP